jgi:hypothetical protein
MSKSTCPKWHFGQVEHGDNWDLFGQCFQENVCAEFWLKVNMLEVNWTSIYNNKFHMNTWNNIYPN